MHNTKYLRANSYESSHSQYSHNSFSSNIVKVPSDESINKLISSEMDSQCVSTAPKKLIKSKKDLLVIISMGLIFFIGQTANSVIAPFFTLEVCLHSFLLILFVLLLNLGL